jgi:hypothetical protein
MRLLKADTIIKYFTATAIIYAFVQIVYTINHRQIPKENEQLFTHLVGIIEGAFVGSLCAYYWTKSTISNKDGNDPV